MVAAQRGTVPEPARPERIGVIGEFQPVYRAMGTAGWSPSEVDAMLPWQVADFMGAVGQNGPVLRGTQAVTARQEQGGIDAMLNAAGKRGMVDG